MKLLCLIKHDWQEVESKLVGIHSFFGAWDMRVDKVCLRCNTVEDRLTQYWENLRLENKRKDTRLKKAKEIIQEGNNEI